MTDTPSTPATHARAEIARTPKLTWRAYVARAIAAVIGIGLVKMLCDGFNAIGERSIYRSAYQEFAMHVFGLFVCVVATWAVGFCVFMLTHFNERK